MGQDIEESWLITLVIIIVAAVSFVLIFYILISILNYFLTPKPQPVYDEYEWWERNRNSRFAKLIIPPEAIEANPPPKKKNYQSPVHQTKKLMKKMYRAAIGLQRNPSYGWKFKLDQFPSDCTPLLVFINSKSGGQQGSYFKSELLTLLNPLQIIDLADTNPILPLQIFSACASSYQVKILIAGGDGTIGWILDSLVSLQPAWSTANPPMIAILPIGTGNDLANEIGWLSILRNHALPVFLEKVQRATPIPLDRWSMTILPTSQANQAIHTRLASYSISGKSGTGKQSHSQLKSSTVNLTQPPAPTTVHAAKPATGHSFQNYLGIGIDAQIAFQVHQLRTASPSMFSIHPWLNKLYYGYMGWTHLNWSWQMAGSGEAADRAFREQVSLICDGQMVELPEDCQGIVLLNIASYGGGSRLWQQSDRDRAGTGQGDEDSSGRRLNTYESNDTNVLTSWSKDWSDLLTIDDDEEEDDEDAVEEGDEQDEDAEDSSGNKSLNSNESSSQLRYRSSAAPSSSTTAKPVAANNSSRSSNQRKQARSVAAANKKTEVKSKAKRRRWQPVSMADGLLEVVAVQSSLELAQIKLGITSCQKIAQGSSFLVTIQAGCQQAIQLDGEPRLQAGPISYQISCSSSSSSSSSLADTDQQHAANQAVSSDEGKQAALDKRRSFLMLQPVSDEDLLDDDEMVQVLVWAQQQRIITSGQQALIMQEYLQRVEKKTRLQQQLEQGWS